VLRERSVTKKAMLAAFAPMLGFVAFAAWWRSSQSNVTWPAIGAPSSPIDSRVADPATAPARSASTSVREEAAVATVRPAIPADAVWVEVRIVDAVTKAPVPGADVWWKDATTDARFATLTDEERRAFVRAEWFEIDVARGLGWHVRADAHGIVRVHAHLQTSFVVASHDEQMGGVSVAVEDARRGVDLMLERELGLTVRVVDESGNPCARVTVGLDLPDSPLVLTTDAGGQVRFCHLQWRLDLDQGRRVGVPASVRLRDPGFALPPVSFDVLDPPADPVTIVLPPTGELHVSLSGASARAVGDFMAAWWMGEVHAYSCLGPDPDGIVRFRFVPLGVLAQVHARVRGFSEERAVVGPVRPGQVVHVAFELPADSVVVTGRVVDLDGRPIVSTDVALEYGWSWGSGSDTVETDQHGSFELVVGAPRESDDGKLHRFVMSVRRGPFDAVQGCVDSRELRRGRNDLGDIRLGRYRSSSRGDSSSIASRRATMSRSRSSDGSQAMVGPTRGVGRVWMT
jgi:hypothetical protein